MRARCSCDIVREPRARHPRGQESANDDRKLQKLVEDSHRQHPFQKAKSLKPRRTTAALDEFDDIKNNLCASRILPISTVVATVRDLFSNCRRESVDFPGSGKASRYSRLGDFRKSVGGASGISG
jgi:hypothetical protein